MTTNYEISNVVEPYTDRVILTHVSAKSLRKLVRKVKLNNPQAMDRLCSLYLPIIKNIYTNPIVQYILGEDAISIVWEIFISFTKQYQGNNFKYFPGLVKKQLLDRIKNQLRKPGDYKYLVNPTSDTLDTVPKEDNGLNKVDNDANFYALLKGCTKKQIQIAKLIYMYDLDKQYIARILHKHRNDIVKYNAKILSKAKENYYKQQQNNK